MEGYDDTQANYYIDYCARIKTYLTVDYVMISILTLTSMAFSILTVKVKRVVWSEDQVIVIALMFLTGSLVSIDVYFMTQVGFYFNLGWIDSKPSSFLWSWMLPYYTGRLLFLAGVVLNLHKWI